MDTVTTYLDTLVRETHKPEAEVMTWAFQVGLRQLWRERTLGQYLQNEIPRNAAIETVGIDSVEIGGASASGNVGRYHLGIGTVSSAVADAAR